MMKENKIKVTGGDDPWMSEDEFLRRTEKKELKDKLPFVSKKKQHQRNFTHQSIKNKIRY